MDLSHIDLGQLLINSLFSIVAFFGGFLIKSLWGAIDQLRQDMIELNKAIARDYVRRDDFQTHTRRVEEMLDRIWDKLDGKADKKG